MLLITFNFVLNVCILLERTNNNSERTYVVLNSFMIAKASRAVCVSVNIIYEKFYLDNAVGVKQ